MKIHEFAQITGLSTKIIRYSESIGVLSSPKWMPNGYSGIAWMVTISMGPIRPGKMCLRRW